MGKPLSEKHKAKMAAGRAAAKAKKAEQQASENATQQTQTPPQKTERVATPEPTVTITQAQLDKFISLLENTQVNQDATPNQKLAAKAELEGVTVGANGMQGTLYKYPVEADYYPDPTDRIFNMPELSRFAPRENYEIKWTVEGNFYENERTHVYYAEPTFKITILRVMFDEMNQPSNMRAIVGTHIQHEDEIVARMVARDMNLDTTDLRALMDEVRFQRIRRWILDLLVPAYRQQDRVEQVSEMAIDGKVVQMVDISTNADKNVGVDTTAALKNAGVN